MLNSLAQEVTRAAIKICLENEIHEPFCKLKSGHTPFLATITVAHDH